MGYQQVDVLGLCWGGALAQQFASTYPDRCRPLIPHSKFYIFHDGHMGLWMSAQELARVVEEFLTAPVPSSIGCV